MNDMIVIIDYTNHRGERRKRKILPHNIGFKATEWHPEMQWVLSAYDFEKDAMRSFAFKDIHGWEQKDETN